MIEMMVVLVIIGLMSGLAVPRFLRADAEAKLEGDAQRTLLAFRMAKQAASKTNLRHWIVIDPPGTISIRRARDTSGLVYGVNIGNTRLVFSDTLHKKTIFGVVSALQSAAALPGFDPPLTAASHSGLASSDSTWEDCKNGYDYTDSTKEQSIGWKGYSGPPYIITACGGPIADMTEGVAYLTSTGSDNKMYAIAYDRRNVQLVLYRYDKSTNSWEAM